MAEDTKMLAFFVDLFKKADDPGCFTKRMLRQKYLDHANLNCLNSTQEALFENAITQAFQKYEEKSDQADSDNDFKKESSKSNKRKLNSKSHGLKKAKTISSDDDNSSDDFKSNKIKLVNKNRKSANRSNNIEKPKLENNKIDDDDSCSEDEQPLIRKSNSLPENDDVEPKNESSDSENTEPKLADESDDDDFTNKKLAKVKKVSIKDNSDTRTDKIKSSKKNSNKKGPSEDKEDSDVEKMKGYVRMAGIRIMNYQKVFDGCSNKKSKLEKLHEVLKEAGLKGRPSIKACQKLKKKRETAKEVAELDLGNILENKSGRTRRSTGSHKEVKRNIIESKEETKENVFVSLEDLTDSD